MKNNVALQLREFTLIFACGYFLVEGVYLFLFTKLVLLPILLFILSLLYHTAFWASREKRYKEWHALFVSVFLIVITTLHFFSSRENNLSLLLGVLLPFAVLPVYPKKRANWLILAYALVYLAVLPLPFAIGGDPQYNLHTSLAIYVVFLTNWSVSNFLVFIISESEAHDKEGLEVATVPKSEYDNLLSSVSFTVRSTLGNLACVMDELAKTHDTTSASYRNLLEILHASEQSLRDFSGSILMDSTVHPPQSSLSRFELNTFLTARVKANLAEQGYSNSLRFLFDPSLPQNVEGDAEFLKLAIDRIMLEILHKDIRNNRPISLSTLQFAQSTDATILTQIEILCGDVVVSTPVFSESGRHPEVVVDLWKTIKIHRAPHGTAVTFTIPLRRCDAKRVELASLISISAEKPQYSEVEENPEAILSSARVLVVDDNQINRRVMRLTLSDKVQRLDFAQNGKEAVEMVSQVDYDLVLMDIQMPVMDGLQATRLIRQREKNSERRTPIIALTAYAQFGDKESCMEAGMDAYLSKPFENQALFSLMANHMVKEA